MGNSISAATIPALCGGVAISAIELVRLLDPQPGAGTTAAATQAQALCSAVWAFLTLAAAGSFFTSVGLIYRHIRHAGAAASEGAGNRRLPGPVAFMLCASAGLLQLLLFTVQVPGGVEVDHGAAARVLGLAALWALPTAATATYYLGILLIIIRHTRAGGEGGGGAVAGNGPIEAPVGFLAKMAIGAAAGLVCLMAMAALYGA